MKKVVFNCDCCGKEEEEKYIVKMNYVDEAPCYNGQNADYVSLDLCKDCKR